MFEKKNSPDTNEIIALIVKILAALVAVSAAVYAGIKIYERIKFKRECLLCDCCDEDFFDDEDLCDCECCCEETEKDFAEKVAEVTEAEINPTAE